MPTTLLAPFDDVRDRIARHLPRAATGSLVTLDADGLSVAEPGVSLADVAQLFEDLTGDATWLPEGLPVRDVRLQRLTLARGPDGGVALAGVIAWEGVSIAVAGAFPLRVAQVDFAVRRGRLYADAQATLRIDDWALEVAFELPAQVFEVRLEPAQLAAAGPAASLLARRGLVSATPGPKLLDLVVRGSLIHDRLLVHVELADLFTFGPLAMTAASATVDLGGAAGTSMEAAATLRIVVDPATTLEIEATCVVDATGWQVAGTLDTFGTLRVGDLVTAFAKGLGQSLPALPALVADCTLAHLDIALDTRDGHFRIDVQLDWGRPARLAVHLEKQGAALQVRGSLSFPQAVFQLDFEKGVGTNALVVGTFDAAGAAPVPISALLDALTSTGSSPAGAPGKGMDAALAVRGMALALDGQGELMVAAEVDAGIDLRRLGDLPLLGPLLKDAGPLGLTLTPYYLAGGFADPAAARRLMPAALDLGRVGHQVDAAAVALAFDAALEVAGVKVGVEGLGAHYAFATRTLTPSLRGLSIDLRRDPVTVGGGFLNIDGEFLGRVRIGTPRFTLDAMGGFAMVDGTPSMFAYGVLDMPIGGPAFFFVEGLAAGVGLHRDLLRPTIDQVRAFPLVAAAGVKPGAAAPPKDMLAQLHAYVQPRLGEYFVAAGIKFNSFRLLHGFALLVVSAGRSLEIDLIGTADFASPPDLPDDVPALARVQLDLLARILPDEGRVAVEARLDPRSYVYGPLCHLSGGFAFYAWSRGALAGDFVLSVGGYNAAWDRPAHYPVVPRVELRYQVSPEVYLKGEAYFALTPALMMAGGALHAHAEVGALVAWADFSVDFWVSWEPFHYDARLDVSFGAQWKCFHTHAAVDLHVWGPAFSGSAHVQWAIFSFDVTFGATTQPSVLPISPAKFMKSFLDVDLSAPRGASHDATLGVTLVGGIAGSVAPATGGGAPLPVVTPHDLRIATTSRMPLTSASLGTRDLGVSAGGLGLAPCGFATLTRSAHTVTVTDDAGADVSHLFERVETSRTGFPPALWASQPPARNAPPILAPSGVLLRPASTRPPADSRDLRADTLVYADDTTTAPLAWTVRTAPAAVPATLPLADLAALGLPTDGLVAVAPPSGRNGILLGGRQPGVGHA